MLKKKKILSYLAYAIGEILLIVVGILLALYLQNRNESKKIEQTSNITLSLIKDEITTNIKAIERVQAYHVMIRDTLKKIDLPKNEQDLEKSLDFWRGMRTPRLQNAAFQTSIQSGVNKEFDPELLSALNNLYTYQDSYNAFNTTSAQIFFNADFTDINSFGKVMASVQMTMNDLYYYEKELVEMFDFCLAKINAIQTQKDLP